ncbi:unnamed protein product [marine sediment metagenome]|uniref:Uncharacterized protein n=1 Tax=marine sediment metagenome TaxID=412755 RepID=X1T7D5_9ZZZZ
MLKPGDPSATFLVGDGDDDAFETGSGLFRRTEVHISVSADPNPLAISYTCGGFRFPNVTIPQASTINTATFSGYIYDAAWDRIKGVIYGNNVDNPLDFLANANIITVAQRPRTAANVAWVFENLPIGWNVSPSIVSIIQELVNRPLWVSGNAVVLLFIMDTDVIRACRFYAIEQAAGFAARLAVDWTPPAPPPAPPENPLIGKPLIGADIIQKAKIR